MYRISIVGNVLADLVKSTHNLGLALD